MKPFEIGVVYKSSKGLCVAFAPDSLLTFRKGVPCDVRPRTRVETVRGLAVEDLCDHWNVTLEALDAALAERLPKPEFTGKSRRSGQVSRRREAQQQIEEFKRSKSVRIARA